MPNAVANRSKLSFKTETNWNETPSTGLALKNWPFTKESLDYTKMTATSKEVRSDRNIRDLVLLGFESKGNIDQEMTDYSEIFKTFLSALLMQTPNGTLTQNATLGANGFTAYNSAGKTVFVGSAEATATGILSFTGQPANNDTFTINGHVYTWKTILTGAADEVKIGSTEAISITNAAAAINGTAGAGTTYGTGTITNADVTAVAAATTLTLTAIIAGTAGNAVTTTELGASTSFGGATLTGGVDESVPPVGRAIMFSNLFNSGVNTPAIVMTTGPGTFTVSPAIAPAAATNLGSAVAVRADAVYSWREVKNGAVPTSFFIEKYFSDINEAIAFGGMMIDTGKVTIQSKSIMGLSFTFMGGSGYQLSKNDYTVASRDTNSGNVMSSSQNVSALIIGNNTAPIKNSTIDVKNNLRGQDAVGSLAFIGIGTGAFEATVTQDVYFSDANLYNIMKSHGAVAAVHAMIIGNYAICFYAPNVKLSKGAPDVTGINTDVMLAVEGQAILSTAEGASLIVSISALS